MHHRHTDPKKHKDSDKMFHEIATHLNGATEILVMGPGQAKDHIVSHLKNHHHEQLAKKVVGVETVDHPTDNQILDHARRFFKKIDVFTYPRS
jgi:stalled ribosome rescue protein Dom34